MRGFLRSSQIPICAAPAAFFLTLFSVQAQDNCVTSKEAAALLERRHGEQIRFRAAGKNDRSYEVYLTPDASRGSFVVLFGGCVIGLYDLGNWQDVVGGDDA